MLLKFTVSKKMRVFGAGYTTNFDQQDYIPQSSDAKEMGEVPFALPSSSKWEVADRQEKMGKEDFIDGRKTIKAFWLYYLI